MGQLIMLTRKSGAVAANGKYYKNRNYKNKYAVENLIHYVTRTRQNEDRASDLLGYGVLGVSEMANVDQIISWFLYIQKIHNIDGRGGKRMYHEVFGLKNEEIAADNWSLNPQNLLDVAWECSRVFYEAGHQVVYALHWEPDKHYHIHFAVNSIKDCLPARCSLRGYALPCSKNPKRWRNIFPKGYEADILDNVVALG